MLGIKDLLAGELFKETRPVVEGLPLIERVIDESGIADLVEDLLPGGGRPRQLSVRTLFVGILAASIAQRDLKRTWIYRILRDLPEDHRVRLGLPTSILVRSDRVQSPIGRSSTSSGG